MNFEVMPELEHPYGYPIALGLMITIASSVVLYLRKHRWFD
jgi:magnesium transporter